MRLSLKHGEGSGRQPPLKTRESGSVLCLLTKLYFVSSPIIHKSAIDRALSEFPENPQIILHC